MIRLHPSIDLKNIIINTRYTADIGMEYQLVTTWLSQIPILAESLDLHTSTIKSCSTCGYQGMCTDIDPTSVWSPDYCHGPDAKPDAFKSWIPKS